MRVECIGGPKDGEFVMLTGPLGMGRPPDNVFFPVPPLSCPTLPRVMCQLAQYEREGDKLYYRGMRCDI